MFHLGSSPDGLLDMTNGACLLQGALTEVAVLIKPVLMVLNLMEFTEHF